MNRGPRSDPSRHADGRGRLWLHLRNVVIGEEKCVPSHPRSLAEAK